jgi:exopolysaccharide production protein ExoQ
MTHIDHSLARPTSRGARVPWLLFVFLAVAFFYVYHDVAYAKDGYNPSQDTLTASIGEGSPTRRVALLSLGIFAVVTLIRHRNAGGLQINGLLGWMLVGFLLLAVVSPIWAEDRALTITRVAGFAMLCIGAVAVVRRFSLREVILWTVFASGSYLLIGVLLEVFFGTFHPLAAGYRFAGTLHPNMQGINCALLLISGLAAADVEKQRRRLFWICALIGFVFLVLTGSRTAFAAVLLALAVYLGVVSSIRAKMMMAYALAIVFCLLALILGNAFLPDLKGAVMLGRDDANDSSLNGRAAVWEEIGHYVQQRPILGYGYGGFWTPAHIAEISEEEKWAIPNSHSAYLDYLLTLGAVGLIAYVFILSAGIKRAFRFHKLSRNSAFAFCGALLLFCALDGLLESGPGEASLLLFVTAMVLTLLGAARPALIYGTNGSAA